MGDKIDTSYFYKGEAGRDASAKIRGFFFQDMVAIDELLDDDTEYILCEYVEDVTVFTKENECKVIQVKYYTSGLQQGMTDEVVRELYYQYLRLGIEYPKIKVNPVFKYFAPSIKFKKDADDYWDNLITSKINLQGLTYDQNTDLSSVYEKNKENREKELFSKYAQIDHFKEFYKKLFSKYNEKQTSTNNQQQPADEETCNISEVETDLQEYRKSLGKKLLQYIKKEDTVLNYISEEEAGLVLYDIADQLIKQKYNRFDSYKKTGNDDIVFLNKKIEKNKFFDSIRKCITISNETINDSIVSLLRTYCDSTYEIVAQKIKGIKKGDVHQEIIDEVYKLCQETKLYIKKEFPDEAKQYKLLCSIYNDNLFSFDDYKTAGFETRIRLFHESKDSFAGMLNTLWKLMYYQQEYDISAFLTFSDNYMEIHLSNDIGIGEHAILCGNTIREFEDNQLQAHMERIVNCQEKPDKWYISTQDASGRFSYGQDVSQFLDEDEEHWTAVSELGPEEFWIECLDCIRKNSTWCNKMCLDNILGYKCKKGDQ